jgi:hypothetical protein
LRRAETLLTRSLPVGHGHARSFRGCQVDTSSGQRLSISTVAPGSLMRAGASELCVTRNVKWLL